MRVVFFHNQSGDDAIDAIRELPSCQPKVILDSSIKRENCFYAGISTPRETTLVLLRKEFIRASPVAEPAAPSLAWYARAVALAALAIAVAAVLHSVAFGP